MNAANPNWGNAVGEKILWMANQQLSSADIRLDPPELGSLQVKVTVQQDQANITFISPHPQVRELLDQQVTRLREMFAEQGLNLGQVDIADKREQQSDQSDEESKTKSRFVSEESEETQVASISSLYLVDQFV
jgi:flagellar hook-length control protein FliK